MLTVVPRASLQILAALFVLTCSACGLIDTARAEGAVSATASDRVPFTRAFDGTPDAAQWASGRPSMPGTSVLTASPTIAPPPSFFSFSDTIISYRFQGPSAEPGLGVRRPDGTRQGRLEPREVPKNVVNLFHANAWTYGTNLLSLDILRSGSQDPAGDKQGNFEGVGATEVYLIYRGVLSGNKIFDTTAFSIPGLVKDVGLSFGADINTKDTTFDSEKRAGTVGLNFAFDLPAGFLNLKLQAYKEFSRNGFAVGRFRSVGYLMTPEFEVTYSVPLTFTGLPLSLAGFNTIILPKGRYGGANENQTQLEFVSQTNLVLDVGQLIADVPSRVEVFVGFQYWHNKFGGDPRRTINTEEKALIAGVSYHLK